MDIDVVEQKKKKQRAEGRCFWCDKKRHLSKDCPDKKPRQEVCALEVAKVPLSKDTKIEEVKE